MVTAVIKKIALDIIDVIVVIEIITKCVLIYIIIINNYSNLINTPHTRKTCPDSDFLVCESLKLFSSVACVGSGCHWFSW